MFSITITTDDPQVIMNIAKAVKNTPPMGFSSVTGPPEVVIHAPPEKFREAKENLNVNEEVVEIKEEPIEPTPIPATESITQEVEAPPAPNPATGQELRRLLLNVANLEDQNIQTAKKIAAEAAGIDPSGINKDFPNHPKVREAMAALEALL